jgi:O-acetyl-ADP-ribose deacetylase (regulator of RNase III)
MPVKVIKGDLFYTDCSIILHGCNSRGVMGSGVAKTIKQLYPKAYEEYALWCSKKFTLGLYQAVDCGSKIIINAVTQQNYGKVSEQTGPNPVRHVSYDAVADIMKHLNIDYAGRSIAMPMIGSSLGGGKWPIIESIIRSELLDVQALVYVQ